ENATYKIWVEDARSINLKSSLVHKYNLAGTAAWRRGFETEDIWQVLTKNLKEKQNYTQWAKANGLEDRVFD
ncbi:MAG: glycoside hydrolase, partial [Firmicutes bacterium]|nr:glycoside hydrolase [Bacillota bacterium]